MSFARLPSDVYSLEDLSHWMLVYCCSAVLWVHFTTFYIQAPHRRAHLRGSGSFRWVWKSYEKDADAVRSRDPPSTGTPFGVGVG